MGYGLPMPSRVQEESFRVTYDGPSVDDGRMDVRDLAPALLAVAEGMQEAQMLLAPGAPPVSLHITATREGSFIVDLALVSDNRGIFQTTIDVLAGQGVTAGVNLQTIVAAAVGAILLLKKLKNRHIATTQPADLGTITVTFVDGTQITIPGASLQLAQSVTFRQRIRELVAPVTQPGINEVRISYRDTVIEIDESETVAFELPPVPDELLLENDREVIVSLVNVSFKDGNKWKFSDGAQTFWAEVHDLPFLTRVERNVEAFRSGDMLRVQLHSRQYRTGDGLKTDHTISLVKDHLTGSRSIPLPFDEPPE